MYKKLNQSGKEFIRFICTADGGENTDMFVGKMKYDLPLSNNEIPAGGIQSIIIDNNGNQIETNTEYANYLIFLFEKYAQELSLDSNILAAQAYVESGYKTYYYDKSNSKSGLVGLNSKIIYDYVVDGNNPKTEESLATLGWTQNEIQSITNGLVEPLNRNSYIYLSFENDVDSIEIARNNRLQLLTNISSNPDLMIKAQANLFSEITARNNYILSSTLFSYNRGINFTSKDYALLLGKTGKKFGNTYTAAGIQYVEKIFQALSDKNNDKLNLKTKKPKGISFGFNYDLKIDDFNAFLG